MIVTVVVYAPAERALTLPLFLLYPYMYSVVYSHQRRAAGYRGLGIHDRPVYTAD